ncbi:hypothetical protein Tco_0426505, partial [Tanacetum coccineum]
MDKEEKIKKAAEEGKLLAMNKPELIKVVQEEATKKKRLEQYTWTTSIRLKHEPITDVNIYPNTKPAVLTYKGNDRRKFDVHSPFKFADFVVTELDELGPIIE